MWGIPYYPAMSVAEQLEGFAVDWVPTDTFAARLALVRQYLGGWNVKRVADFCGIGDQSWRNWEAGKEKPRNYEGVCRAIADATGCDERWLMAGGPLRSRWFMTDPLLTTLPLPPQAQLELLDSAGVEWNRRPDLTLVDQ